MYKCKKHILSTSVIMLCFLQFVFSQNCSLPILSNFNNTTQSGFNAIWIDFNNDLEFFEIEFGIKSFTRTLEPNVTGISDNNYTFDNLLPGTTYEIYIRSVCNENNFSDWNGPYFNNTNIDNDSSCDLALGISDNNCPIRNSFNIEVKDFDNRILGTDINLENIALSIEHTWPPDLDILLVSPNGKSAILSSHNGNGIDNYGDPNSNCSVNANFNDKSCISVSDWTPPFQGDFNAEVELASAFDGEPANGIWQLSICDRAVGDVGQLTYINLEFSTETCQAPQDFIIFDVEGTNAVFKWKKFENCKSIRLIYNEIGAPAEEVFIDIVDCNSESFTATGLKENTLYELTVDTECDEGLTSNPLCSLNFTTRCGNSTFQEYFDAQNICALNCDSLCAVTGLWKLRDTEANGWFVQNGNNSNSFTGPSGDKNYLGNFLQVDPSINCVNNSTALLTTDCLDLSKSSNCGISFYYHMFGDDVGSLFLEYSVNELDWIPVWELNGNQGNDWFFESVALNNIGENGRLRFRSEAILNSNQGVIAIDQIKLYDTDTVALNVYFLDSDGDGFGDKDSMQLFCSFFDIDGYSKNNMDCDDNDANINPLATEISCNQIDENCNGPVDDAQTVDIETNILSIKDETCKGSSDGEIEIIAIAGIPPFEYEWSNSATTSLNVNLTSGVYVCTVTGGDGCQTITPPIFVGFDKILVYNVDDILNASCQGESDGSITINVAGGTEPYTIDWPNGDTGFSTSQLDAGIYVATISGSDGCSILTDPIEVLGNQILTTGVAIKNDIDCNGDSTGFVQLGIIGGTLPYTTLWSHGDTSAFVSNLKAGNYSVTISDSLGCFNVIDDIIIDEPDVLELVLNRKQDVICHGDENASIDINVNGGTPPYSYFWSNGTFKQDLFNIGAGIYSVTVSDFKACSVVFNNINVTEPDVFDIRLDSISSVSCSGSNEGYVGIEVFGGSTPYAYNWSNFDGINTTKAYISSLLPGQYFVTVVDAFGCKSLPGKFEVNNQNIPINISLSQLNSIECFADSTASIVAISSSSNLPLDFNWSAGVKQIKESISDTITSLIANSYNITVTDNEGCVGISDSIFIEQPSEIIYSVGVLENNICYDGDEARIVINANGGTGDLNYLWSNLINGNEIVGLSNGIYQVTITDDLGCSIISEELNISSPSEIMIDAVVSSSSENTDGSIVLSIEGGTFPYQFSWSTVNIGNSSFAIGLSTGEYSVTITDANDCQRDTTIFVDFVSDLNELDESKFVTFYPNPVENILHIDCQKINCYLNLKMIRIDGKVIQSFKNFDKKQIDLSQYENGIYFIETFAKGFRQLSKIIVFH